jgi:ABC-2 type transport system permease protein
MLNSLRDEIEFLFSGKGMPYQKVAFMVAIVCTVFFTITFGNNVIHEAPIAVIDLDNSKYSHELIDTINASPFMHIKKVFYSPIDAKTLFYQDKYVAVIVMPKDLEKNRYSNTAGSIGVMYDDINGGGNTGNMREYLNELVAQESLKIVGATEDSPGVTLHERNLFNPQESLANGSEVQGFLFFFSSMFFVFATIGMIPRLRMEGKLQQAAAAGAPLDILVRLVPYGACLLTALFVGMAILRVFNDMTFSGSIFLLLFTQLLYIPTLGILSLIFGWSAANPGLANSRMIFFIPGGFIFGGSAGPLFIQDTWVQVLSHVFPLRWEFEFVRDVILRGAGFWDIASEIGGFLLYGAIIIVIFYWKFTHVPLTAKS